MTHLRRRLQLVSSDVEIPDSSNTAVNLSSVITMRRALILHVWSQVGWIVKGLLAEPETRSASFAITLGIRSAQLIRLSTVQSPPQALTSVHPELSIGDDGSTSWCSRPLCNIRLTTPYKDDPEFGYWARINLNASGGNRSQPWGGRSEIVGGYSKFQLEKCVEGLTKGSPVKSLTKTRLLWACQNYDNSKLKGY